MLGFNIAFLQCSMEGFWNTALDKARGCYDVIVTNKRNRLIGADDLIIKPVKPRELIARFQTRLLTLQKHSQGSSVAYCGLTLDKEHRIVSGPMGREFLPPIESLMLATLLAARGTVVPKETLKHEAWGLNAVSDNAFHRKLFELRRAVQSVSKDVSIRSLYGRGIVLDTSLSGEDDLSELAAPRNIARPNADRVSHEI